MHPRLGINLGEYLYEKNQGKESSEQDWEACAGTGVRKTEKKISIQRAKVVKAGAGGNNIK